MPVSPIGRTELGQKWSEIRVRIDLVREERRQIDVTSGAALVAELRPIGRVPKRHATVQLWLAWWGDLVGWLGRAGLIGASF
jgi:hypothetical protein